MLGDVGISDFVLPFAHEFCLLWKYCMCKMLVLMFCVCVVSMQVPTPRPQNYIWRVPCLLQLLSPLHLRFHPVSTQVPILPGVMPPTLPWLSRILPLALLPMACFLTMIPSCILSLTRLCFPLPWPSIIFLPLLWAHHSLYSPPLTAQPKSLHPTSCSPSLASYLLPYLPLIVRISHLGRQFSQALLKEPFSVNVVWSNTTRGLLVSI